MLFRSPNTLKGYIGNVNADILAHRYEYLKEPEILPDISILSVPDIIAMKLNAISTSGQRSKDFIDIFYLLKYYNVGDMIEFYRKKYRQEHVAHVLKSLVYFDDIDLSDWPVIIENPRLKWSIVKKQIEKSVLDFCKDA